MARTIYLHIARVRFAFTVILGNNAAIIIIRSIDLVGLGKIDELIIYEIESLGNPICHLQGNMGFVQTAFEILFPKLA